MTPRPAMRAFSLWSMSGAPGEQIETERKYEAGPDFTVPGLAGLAAIAAVAEPRTYELAAVYFDTTDLRLISAHVTLRRRTGGADAGWHLKLPAGEETRREVHEPLGGADVVPARLAGLVSGWTKDEPVRPVARIQTTRAVRGLLDDGGTLLAEIADDQVTGSLPAGGPGDGWRPVISWREVEVELAAGSRDLLEAVGARLREAGATPSSSPSKLSMVLKSAGVLPGQAGDPGSGDPGSGGTGSAAGQG